MEFDFFDEPRTRLQIQAGPFSSPVETKDLNWKEVASSIGFATLLLGYAWTSGGLLQFAVVWLALAFLVGPFAPLSATGGNCRVGVGESIPERKQDEAIETEISKRTSRQQRKARNGENLERSAGNVQVCLPEKATLLGDEYHKIIPNGVLEDEHTQKAGIVAANNETEGLAVEAEWTSEDIDRLRKQLIKHPRGKLKRWDIIAEAFTGTHTLESVVRMSKALSEKKAGDGDSFSKFLAQRKGSTVITSPLSQRWDSDGTSLETVESNEGAIDEEGKAKRDWTDVEDKSLLTALKTFPKDTSMRWEKIAVAVPGKSKTQCFRRFTELKENFRSTKADKNIKALEFD